MSRPEALGDQALVLKVPVRDGEESWRRTGWLVRRIEAIGCEGIAEVVAGLDSVAVHLKRSADWWAVAREVEAVADEGWGMLEGEGREVVIPVCYGGEAGADLGRVAELTGLAEAEVTERHAAGRYRVRAIGFAPGFPYLSGLDEGLWCGRLETPRTRVAAGSVGIGGGQTGVYPVELPGGWNVIGRTGVKLFDPQRDSPNLLRAGDVVKFEAVDEVVPAVNVVEVCGEEGAGGGAVEVVEPGLCGSVQDLGRVGLQKIGVTEGGAMDRRALLVGNLLVGNEPGAAGLEWGLRGPKLLFRERRAVAVTGGRVEGVVQGRPFFVQAGEVLDVSRMPGGGRGYLAIEGGIDVPVVLGGQGANMTGGFGGLSGRTLLSGDVLPLGEGQVGGIAEGWWVSPVLAPRVGRRIEVRVIRGPEMRVFGESGWERLLSEVYVVGVASDRMGTRLEGGAIEAAVKPAMVSQPVVAGTVQVPGDGQPIVMMADRQSLGGYPRIGVVISVDVALLAQATPGCEVRFVECDLAEAQRARLREEQDLELFGTAVRERLELI